MSKKINIQFIANMDSKKVENAIKQIKKKSQEIQDIRIQIVTKTDLVQDLDRQLKEQEEVILKANRKLNEKLQRLRANKTTTGKPLSKSERKRMLTEIESEKRKLNALSEAYYELTQKREKAAKALEEYTKKSKAAASVHVISPASLSGTVKKSVAKNISVKKVAEKGLDDQVQSNLKFIDYLTPKRMQLKLDIEVDKQKLNDYKVSLQDIEKQIDEVRISLSEYSEVMRAAIQEERAAMNDLDEEIKSLKDIEKSLVADTRGKYREEIAAVTEALEEAKKALAAFGSEETEIGKRFLSGEATSQDFEQLEVQRQIVKELSKKKDYMENQLKIGGQLILNEKEYLEVTEKIKELEDKKSQHSQNVSKLMAEKRRGENEIRLQRRELESQKREIKEASDKVMAELIDKQKKFTELEAEGYGLKKLFGGLGQQIKQYFTIAGLVRIVESVWRSASRFSKEIDKALTAIGVVTKMTRNELWALAKDFNQIAIQVGATTTEVAHAAKLFYQQGLQTKEVLELTKASVITSKLAGVEIAKATDLMTAALKAYKLEASESMNLADKFAALAASTATDFYDIAYALTKVGTGAKMAGVDIDHMLSYLAVASSVTQEAPENIGEQKLPTMLAIA